MNRRQSLKAIGLSTITAGLLLEACNTDTKAPVAAEVPADDNTGREAHEIEREKRLKSEVFFTKQEMLTIIALADIIIPEDETSVSASKAGVPEFIEYIVKDMPAHKIPMRGGLKWLDVQCLNRYGNVFTECSSQQQLSLIDEIAYPKKAKQEMKAGVAFFNRMRSLTASGFFSSREGIAYIGYAGNKPNKWEGVPKEVLAQYGLNGNS